MRSGGWTRDPTNAVWSGTARRVTVSAGLGVKRRRRDIGIRMAVGATGSDVIWAMLRRGLGPVRVGASVRDAIALCAGPQLDGLCSGRARDPWSAVVAALLHAMSAVAGCIMPAGKSGRPRLALEGKETRWQTIGITAMTARVRPKDPRASAWC